MFPGYKILHYSPRDVIDKVVYPYISLSTVIFLYLLQCITYHSNHYFVSIIKQQNFFWKLNLSFWKYVLKLCLMCSKYKVLTLESYINDDALKINFHIYAIFTAYSKYGIICPESL